MPSHTKTIRRSNAISIFSTFLQALHCVSHNLWRIECAVHIDVCTTSYYTGLERSTVGYRLCHTAYVDNLEASSFESIDTIYWIDHIPTVWYRLGIDAIDWILQIGRQCLVLPTPLRLISLADAQIDVGISSVYHKDKAKGSIHTVRFVVSALRGSIMLLAWLMPDKLKQRKDKNYDDIDWKRHSFACVVHLNSANRNWSFRTSKGWPPICLR